MYSDLSLCSGIQSLFLFVILKVTVLLHSHSTVDIKYGNHGNGKDNFTCVLCN